jgi:hypothetical protein
MMTTLAELILRAKRGLKIPLDDDDYVTPEEWREYANMALTEMASEPLEFAEEQLALVAGDRWYPNPLSEIRAVLITGDTVGLGRTSLDQAVAESTVRGRPVAYIEELERVGFDPVPDGAYTATLFGALVPAELDDEESEITLPARYITPLVEFMKGRVKIREEEFDTAKVYLDFWGQFLESARVVDRRRRNRQFGGPIPRGKSRPYVPAFTFPPKE